MRGKQKYKPEFSSDSRITPADAGKTRSKNSRSSKGWDHPRGCGENGCYKYLQIQDSGSPPRMRGKLAKINKMFNLNRITPADAGKTLQADPVERRCRDHPRGCGENDFFAHIFLRHRGSPPRMRGKPMPEPAAGAKTRITPADAGKTQCHTSKYSR